SDLMSKETGIASLSEVTADFLKSNNYQNILICSKLYRERQTKENRLAYEAVCSDIADNLSRIDLDGDISSNIIINIELFHKKNTLSIIKATHPPKGSQKFKSYLDRIQNAKIKLSNSREIFIKSNLRLVVSVARRYYKSMPMSDIIQEGNFGLMKAVDRFDGSRGLRFSTYATWWIRHSINRAIANKARLIRLPAGVSADLQKIKRVYRE